MKDDALPPNELLRQARRGDRDALGRLLEAQRTALLRRAEHQLEGRVAARVGASDVIQQSLLEAYRDFLQFAGTDVRELVAWLRSILDQNDAAVIRDHSLLQKRNVGRERSLDDSRSGAGPFKPQAPSPNCEG